MVGRILAGVAELVLAVYPVIGGVECSRRRQRPPQEVVTGGRRRSGTAARMPVRVTSRRRSQRLEDVLVVTIEGFEVPFDLHRKPKKSHVFRLVSLFSQDRDWGTAAQSFGLTIIHNYYPGNLKKRELDRPTRFLRVDSKNCSTLNTLSPTIQKYSWDKFSY